MGGGGGEGQIKCYPHKKGGLLCSRGDGWHILFWDSINAGH